MLHQDEGELDVMGRLEPKTRVFTINSAYRLEAGWDDGATWPGWSLVWRLKVQQRVKECMMLIAHKRLLTNFSRWRQGLSTSAACQLCSKPVGDTLHMLRDNKSASKVWCYLYPLVRQRNFFSLNLKDRLANNMIRRTTSKDDIGWAERMLIVF